MSASLEASKSRISPKLSPLINFIGFQVGWFACVLGAAFGSWWFGPVVVCLLFVLHTRLREDWKIDLYIVIVAMAVGLIGDSLLALCGVIEFRTSPFPAWISPPWMVFLWANFAFTLRTSLNWLRGRYFLGSVLGLISGPLAYVAGERLEAIRFAAELPTAILILAVFWGAATPLLLFIASRGEIRWK